MKRSHKTAAGIVAALTLGVAAAAFAQPGPMGAGHSPMTPEERQKLAQATREEMQKRAKEKGITLPEHRGPHQH